MRCKHNRHECIKDELFCVHCGMLIQKKESITGDIICKIKHTGKETVKITTEADVLEENQTGENISHACRKHVLDLSQEGKIKMIEAICKMSIDEANLGKSKHGMYVNFVCGLALNVKCEGKRADSNNCPFWKRGDGEP